MANALLEKMYLFALTPMQGEPGGRSCNRKTGVLPRININQELQSWVNITALVLGTIIKVKATATLGYHCDCIKKQRVPKTNECIWMVYICLQEMLTLPKQLQPIKTSQNFQAWLGSEAGFTGCRVGGLRRLLVGLGPIRCS